MSLPARELGPGLERWESTVVCMLVWMALIAIPLASGGIGLSWDALNHHIYLGWVADASRFDRDVLAASYQSYQFPYLYWPVYKLAAGGWSGQWAGAVLASLHALAAPPLWMLSRTCIPGSTVFDICMRAFAVAMAFSSGVVLSMFDTTANDLLAAVPMVWALALAMEPLTTRHTRWLMPARAIVLSGVMAGIAVACKLSNGPMVLVLPGIWFWVTSGTAVARMRITGLGCLAIGLSYFLVYGYWGLQLWGQFGNPIYPFYDQLFAPIRQLMDWKP